MTADTICTAPVSEIDMSQTSVFPSGITGDSDVVTNDEFALTQNLLACQAGGFLVSATAFITFPPDTPSREELTRSTPPAQPSTFPQVSAALAAVAAVAAAAAAASSARRPRLPSRPRVSRI
ncbi:MAG TPA: hypothetical protein VH594_04210 [Trebonia sp.]